MALKSGVLGRATKQGASETMPSKGATASPAQLLKQLDQSIDAVKKEAEEKSQYLKSLVTAREAVAKGVLANATRPRNAGNGASTGNRTQMLKTILQAAPHPVTVDEIMAEMQKHGRAPDDRRLVYSTLSYLRRSGLAKPAERGKWIAVTEEGTAKAA